MLFLGYQAKIRLIFILLFLIFRSSYWLRALFMEEYWKPSFQVKQNVLKDVPTDKYKEESEMPF